MPVPSKSSKMATTKPTDMDIVRIAVQLALGGGQPQNKLIQFSKKQSLDQTVSDLCKEWKLDHPENYALMFEGHKAEYVNERNKLDIKDGTILKLSQSPQKLCHEVLAILKSSDTDSAKKKTAFLAIHKISDDLAIALELIKQNGFDLLLDCLRDDPLTAASTGDVIGSVYELMKHELIAWTDDRFDGRFVAKVASTVDTDTNMKAFAQEEKTIQNALSILESMTSCGSMIKYQMVEKETSFHSLLNFLQSDDLQVKQNALALINALFQHGDPTTKKKIKRIMEERNVRQIIVNSILRNSQASSGEEMKHQLYVLQTLLLNQLEERMYSTVDCPEHKDKIKELRQIAFDFDGSPNRTAMSMDFKKLGFKHIDDPSLDFAATPPGMLALDLMVSFARNHRDQFTKLIVENSCRPNECPFAMSSIELVKLMCHIIKIGEAPSEEGNLYPMFFTNESPLEEFFSISVIHLHKTWREMRATIEDFPKVIDVVREQIITSLKNTPQTLDDFKRGLKSYGEITEIWKEEAKLRGERDSKPILELREMLKPDILDLIQQQRLNYLVEGTRFSKYRREGGRDRSKFWYCKLSPNHKTLCYGDWNDDSSVPVLDNLQQKIQVADIKDLLTGASCPHVQKSKRPSSEHLAFSIVADTVTLDFVAPDQKTFDYWTDAVNSILRRGMVSHEAKKDLDTLLSIEVKLRLLDLDGGEGVIPDEPPPVPPSPPNYDFCCQLR